MILATLQSLARRAMRGVPHQDPDETVRMLSALTDAERTRAGAMYASLVGERFVAAHVGRRDPRATGSPARDFLNRQAAARRAIEARRDARV